MGGTFSFCAKRVTVDSKRSMDENVKAMETKIDALYMKMQLLKIKTLLRGVRDYQKKKKYTFFAKTGVMENCDFIASAIRNFV